MATDHLINLAEDRWELLHPPDCGDGCEVLAAVIDLLRAPPCLGRHPCRVEAGALVIDCDRQVFDGVDRIDPATARPPIVEMRVNRLGHEPQDKAVIRDSFNPWGRG